MALTDELWPSWVHGGIASRHEFGRSWGHGVIDLMALIHELGYLQGHGGTALMA